MRTFCVVDEHAKKNERSKNEKPIIRASININMNANINVNKQKLLSSLNLLESATQYIKKHNISSSTPPDLLDASFVRVSHLIFRKKLS